MRLFFLFAILLSFTIACSKKTKLPEQYLGHWDIPMYLMAQHWEQKSDTLYQIRNYNLEGPKDTTWTNSGQLVLRKNKLIYIRSIGDGSTTLEYPLVSQDSNRFVYENLNQEKIIRLTHEFTDLNHLKTTWENKRRGGEITSHETFLERNPPSSSK